ncbi:MAG: hypothetical protein V7603_5127 [Micromonosporaceae bacterium]
MSQHRRGDRADIEALRAAYQVEQGKLNEVIVITEAETAATSPRREELVAMQQAAHRRLSAARGQLTKAQKNGHVEKIAAARARLDAANAEFDSVADTVIAEMQGHIRARLDNIHLMGEQMSRAWDAGSAITEAFARRRPPAS